MRIVNRTPHEITVLDGDGRLVARYAPEGEPIRIGTEVVHTVYTTDGKVPVHGVRYGAVGNAPERTDEALHIVSLPVALAANRDDFLVPYGEVRDEKGQIVGCRGLALAFTA